MRQVGAVSSKDLFQRVITIPAAVLRIVVPVHTRHEHHYRVEQVQVTTRHRNRYFLDNQLEMSLAQLSRLSVLNSQILLLQIHQCLIGSVVIEIVRMLLVLHPLDAVIKQGAEDRANNFTVSRQVLVLLVCRVTVLILVQSDVVDSLDHVPVFVLVGGGHHADVLENLICGLQGFAHFFELVPMVG